MQHKYTSTIANKRAKIKNDIAIIAPVVKSFDSFVVGDADGVWVKKLADLFIVHISVLLHSKSNLQNIISSGRNPTDY